MQANRVKRILRTGRLAIGTYVGGLADAQIVELIGHAAQLRELGVGYSNCAPAPETRILRSMTPQVGEIRKQLG